MFELNPVEIEQYPFIQEGGRIVTKLTHVFRRPLLDDWLEYDKRLRFTQEESAEGQSYTDRELEAASAVWDLLVLAVKGYRSRDREGAVKDLLEAEPEPEKWKGKIPLSHRRAAIQGFTLVLLDVKEAEEEDGFLLGDELEVRLRTPNCEGLIHRLRRPSAAQTVRLDRLRSTAYWMQDRQGVTKVMRPGLLQEYVALYDELITGAEGYEVRGVNGTGTLSARECTEWMDALHKRRAVQGIA